MSVRICHYNARRTLDLPYSALDLLLLSQPQPEKKKNYTFHNPSFKPYFIILCVIST